MVRRRRKKERQEALLRALQEDPLLTDAALAARFGVSVQTIRLDRLQLGLPEMRERARELASRVQQIRSMLIDDVMGELLDLKLGQSGRSSLVADRSMGFSDRPIVRGHYIFGQANSLAVAVVDAEKALTGSVQMRFLQPVNVGETIVAEAQVVQRRGPTWLVSVESKVQGRVVFRGMFTVFSFENAGAATKSISPEGGEA